MSREQELSENKKTEGTARKAAYATPRLSVYGSVKQITLQYHGQANGYGNGHCKHHTNHDNSGIPIPIPKGPADGHVKYDDACIAASFLSFYKL